MASSSVNVPTNPKIKEQDVNAKLQLYGIYSGMFWQSTFFSGLRLVAISGHDANISSQPLPMARSLQFVSSQKG
jgi:hypothetical protein